MNTNFLKLINLNKQIKYPNKLDVIANQISRFSQIPLVNFTAKVSKMIFLPALSLIQVNFRKSRKFRKVLNISLTSR